MEVHLFEVNDPGKYTYSGVVKLAGEPYQETQPDDNGNPRKVWMFPLKKVLEIKMMTEKKPETFFSEKESAPEQKKQLDASEVFGQSVVYHNRYGTGIVTQITGTKIYVEFGDQQRIFSYPDAFKKGYLK